MSKRPVVGLVLLLAFAAASGRAQITMRLGAFPNIAQSETGKARF